MAGITLRKYAGKFETAGQNALFFIGYNWNSWSFCYNYNCDINAPSSIIMEPTSCRLAIKSATNPSAARHINILQGLTLD